MGPKTPSNPRGGGTPPPPRTPKHPREGSAPQDPHLGRGKSLPQTTPGRPQPQNYKVGGGGSPTPNPPLWGMVLHQHPGFGGPPQGREGFGGAGESPHPIWGLQVSGSPRRRGGIWGCQGRPPRPAPHLPRGAGELNGRERGAPGVPGVWGCWGGVWGGRSLPLRPLRTPGSPPTPLGGWGATGGLLIAFKRDTREDPRDPATAGGTHGLPGPAQGPQNSAAPTEPPKILLQTP